MTFPYVTDHVRNTHEQVKLQYYLQDYSLWLLCRRKTKECAINGRK